MPSLFSPVPEISNLVFHDWNKSITSKPKDVSIMRIDRTILIRLPGGGITCNNLQGAHLLSNWPWNNSLINALLKLKIITPEMAKTHLDAATLIGEDREAIDDAEEIERLSSKYGSLEKLKRRAASARLRRSR